MKKIIWVFTIAIVYSCGNKTLNSFQENRKGFERSYEILANKYDTIQKMDTNGIHFVTLYASSIKNKCRFLSEGDLNYISEFMSGNKLESAIVYGKDCIAFAAISETGFPNSTMDYIIHAPDLNDFPYAKEIVKEKDLGNNWHYIRRKASLAN